MCRIFTQNMIFGVSWMKYIHFEASGKLAGLATMLECCGLDTEDNQIAFGMDAPWLFLKEGNRFIAGQGLYSPRWMNLYLITLGFRLQETILPKDDVPRISQASFSRHAAHQHQSRQPSSRNSYRLRKQSLHLC